MPALRRVAFATESASMRRADSAGLVGDADMGALDEFLNGPEHRRDYADARIAEAGNALPELQERFKQGGLEAEQLFIRAARVFWKRDGGAVMRRFVETQ